MKKVFFFVLLLTSFACFMFGQDKIRITNGEWEPYLSEYIYEYGIASHIVTEAFKLEGIEVEYGFFPWKRSYEIAKDGSWDASAVWWITEEVKADFLFSEKVVDSGFVFYHLKSTDFDWDSIEDLRGLKIGFTSGYQYGPVFSEAMENGTIKVETASSDELNFKKLLSGRIDVFPNDPLVGWAQIRNNFTDREIAKFTNHPKKFFISSLALLISRNTSNGSYFLRKFNSGLSKLERSGRLDEIFEDFDKGKYNKMDTEWHR